MVTSEAALESLLCENSKLRNEVNYLKEQVEWFKRQLFGKRSEKIAPISNEAQLELLNLNLPEKPEEKLQTVPAHVRKKPSRDGQDKITLPEDLPVESQIIDLPEQEKICKETGLALIKIGEDVTQKLAHKPGSYYIKRIIRPKYAVPQTPDAGIFAAPLPDSLFLRCQADESFLADILVKKFGDHLPLYRQSEILSREGIWISRQILSQWVVKVGLALKPLYQEMLRVILESGNVFVDETPIDMLVPGKGKTQQAYMWVLVGGKEKNPAYRIYNFYENRKHSNAAKLLAGYSEILHSDKYGGYESLANAKQFIWCPCWGHIRRKFFEAETGDPLFRAWILRKIRYLYMFERIAWEKSPEERIRIRQQKEVPIIDEITNAIKTKLIDGKILPKSKLKEALGYYHSLIPYLKNYTAHPFAKIDNNVAERAIRPLAIGRKNWLFVGSEDGGEAASVIYSLVQTCRALNINPREYLEDIMRRIMSHNKKDLYELLPDNWSAAKSSKI